MLYGIRQQVKTDMSDISEGSRKYLLGEIMGRVKGIQNASFYIAQGHHRLPRLFYSDGSVSFVPEYTCNMPTMIYRDTVVKADRSFASLEIHETSIRAERDIISLPLIKGGQKLGLLVVESKVGEHLSIRGKSGFDELFFVAQYLTDIAEKYQDMMGSWFNPVTGLLGRSAYESEILPSVKNWVEPGGKHNGYQFALIFFDLDRFKAINDIFGHSAGDEVLRTSAEKLLAKSRKISVHEGALRNCTDWAVHWGGDEFGLVVQSVSMAQALMVAERLRVGLTEVGYVGIPTEKKGRKKATAELKEIERKISASIGVLHSDQIRKELRRNPDFDFGKLLDAIQYQAKEQRDAVAYLSGQEVLIVRGDEVLAKKPSHLVRPPC